MKKVLIITYEFPPSNNPGVYRILRFGKSMQAYGWDPIILTCGNPISDRWDYDNLDSLNENFKYIYHTNTLIGRLVQYLVNKKTIFTYPFRRYILPSIIPDKAGYWIPSAIIKAKKILKIHKIDLIFSTMPWFSTGVVGYMIARKKKIPLCLDYRDPWNLSSYINKKKINNILERKILKQSKVILTTSDPMRELFLQNFSDVKDKIFTITNCIDTSININDLSLGKNSMKLDSSKINITYTGAFYGNRNPLKFLKVLNILLTKNKEMKKNLCFNIVGNKHNEIIRKFCNENDMSSNVKYISAVSHKTALAYCLNSDILLLNNGENKGSEIFIPGKLFDYLLVQKPILFIGEGQPRNIISELRIGESASHNSIDIYNSLTKMLVDLDKYQMDEEKLKKYKVEELTRKMIQIFEEYTHEN